MHIRVERTDFLDLLETAAVAVASRTPQQILTGILIEGRSTSIVAMAYDLEIGIVATMESGDGRSIEIVDEGSIVLPAREFIDILRKLTASMVEIQVRQTDVIDFRAGQFECAFHGMESASFPKLPQTTEATKVRFASKLLRDLIKSTAFAASTSESRPVLMGVYIELDAETIRFSATDSLRLATKCESLTAGTDGPTSVIVPAKSLTELARIIPDDDSEIWMSLTESHCTFGADTIQFHTRVIDGAFVEVTRLIPHQSRTELVVDTVSLMRALDRAAVMAPRSQEVQLDVQSGVAMLHTQSSEHGQLSDVIEVEKAVGDDVSIAFNAKNAMEALRTVKSEQSCIRLSGPRQPLVFTPVDQPNFIHVISPIITRYDSV